MSTLHSEAEVGCEFVGEFVADNELFDPADEPRYSSKGVVEHPVAYIEIDGSDEVVETTREFTVLLRDNRVVTVLGHAVRYLPNASNPTDLGSYGVFVRSHHGDDLVAVFRVSEVTGVFHGAVRPPDSQLTRASA